eukprot:s40_g22.t1
MSILLHISSLAGPLCSVRCEASWTGRQLKEAIEVETKWSELACTQTVAIGSRVIEDADILGEERFTEPPNPPTQFMTLERLRNRGDAERGRTRLRYPRRPWCLKGCGSRDAGRRLVELPIHLELVQAAAGLCCHEGSSLN